MRLAICGLALAALTACGQADPTPVVFTPAAYQTRTAAIAEQRDAARAEERASRSKPRDIPRALPTPTTAPRRRAPSVRAVPAAGPPPATGCGPGNCTGWSTAQASWYGPGFYGHGTACGQRYDSTIVGVANKTLPCGTIVTFEHNGVVVSAPVIDRGPYIAGRTWDLSQGLCQRLGHCFTGTIRYRY